VTFWGIDPVTAVSAAIGTLIAALLKEFVPALVRRFQAAEASRDDDLAQILSSLDMLRELADQYWPQSAMDLGAKEPLLRSHIMANVQHINGLAAALFTGALKQDADMAFIPFMNAISGDDFGDVDRPASPERLTQIHLTALGYRREIIALRRRIPRHLLA
jgi:hypothetical protein